MDKTNSMVINLHTFQTFAFDCWVAAFRNLNNIIQNTDPMYDLPQNGLEAWAFSKRGELNAALSAEFAQYDNEKKGYWTLENFKNWARKSRLNSIYASLGDYSIVVPMHVYVLNLNSNKQPDIAGFATVGNNYNYNTK
jgi:hypothetical protein